MCFRPPVVSAPRVCPECGTINPNNPDLGNICFKCGAELPEDEVKPMECPRCASVIPEGATECPSCKLSGQLIQQADRTIRCPECKQPNSGLYASCVKCGAALPHPWDEVLGVPSAQPPAVRSVAPAAPSAPAAPKAPAVRSVAPAAPSAPAAPKAPTALS